MKLDDLPSGYTVFIDANIFISAAIDIGPDGEHSRAVLSTIENGILEGYSCILTIDEVYYKIFKLRSKNDAQEACRALLTMRGLHFTDASTRVVERALDLMQDTDLLPRDAIHLASMESSGITTIISADSDFDRIKGIKREIPS